MQHKDIHDTPGNIEGRLVIARNITKRKHAEEDLARLTKAEEMFSKIFLWTPACIAISELETGRYLDVNKEFETVLGYSRDEVIGRTSFELGFWVTPIDRGNIVNALQASKELKDYELRMRSKSGQLLVLRSSLQTIEIDGKLLILSAFTDITESRCSEEKLRASEQKYRMMFENIQDIFYRLDAAGTIIEISPSITTSAGYTPEEVVGKPAEDFYADASQREKFLQAIQKRGEVKDFELLLRSRTDQLVYTSVNARITNDKAGRMTGIEGFLRDITARKRAEMALSASEHRYRRLHESIRDGFAVTDMDGHILETNEAYRRMLGYSEKELSGLRFQDLTPEQWHHMEQSILEEQILKNGYSDVYEKEYRRKDGSVFPIEIRTYLLKNEHGDNEGMWGIVRDISERKKAEQALVRLSEAVQASGEVIFMTDREGIITFVNSAFTQLYGFEPKEVIEKATPRILKSGTMTPADYTSFWQEITRGRIVKGEFFNQTKDGRLIAIEGSTNPIQDTNGNTIGFLAVQRDITERKRAEKNIRDLNRIYALLSNINKLLVRTHDKQRLFDETCRIGVHVGKFQMVTIGLVDSARQHIDFIASVSSTGQDIKGQTIPISPDTPEGNEPSAAVVREARFILFRDLDQYRDILPWSSIALQQGIKSIASFPLIVSGNIRGTITFSSPEVDFFNEREVALLDELAADISYAIKFIESETQRRKIEQRLKTQYDIVKALTESESLEEATRKIAEAVHQTLGWEIGEIWSIDQALDRMWCVELWTAPGVEASEFVAFTRQAVLSPTVGLPGMILAMKAPVWIEDVAKNNSAVARTSLMLSHGLHSVFGFPILRGQQIIGMCDFMSSETREPDDELLRMFSTIGMQIGEFIERKRVEAEVKKNEEKYRMLFEESKDTIFITSIDGGIIDVNPAGIKLLGYSDLDDLRAKNLVTDVYLNTEDRKKFVGIMQSRGYVQDFEIVLKTRSGKPVNCLVSANPVRDENGRIIQFRGILRNVTDQKQLEQQLIQAQKLEGIGTLAGGIAHDFNNILGILVGYIELLTNRNPTPELVEQSLKVMSATVDRGSNLVRQILTFARKTESHRGPLDANLMIKEFARMAGETFPKTITISLDLDPSLPIILADATQFHQVIFNICVNARDAMPRGGTITMRTRLIAGSHVRRVTPGAEADAYLHLTIADTGTGMPQEVMDRIFEPFFTMKAEGKGTGLGLSIVYGIVKNHNGFVSVESEPNRGSVFHMYFPIPPHAESVKTNPNPASNESVRGTETVLFIEDEVLLANLVKKVLESNGYRVIVANDGAVAIELYRTHQREIDLVLTDMDLPKFSGEEVFLRLKEMDPRIKLIFASGYVEPEVKSFMLGAGAKRFIGKPYHPVELLTTIRETIDGKAMENGKWKIRRNKIGE